MVVRPKQNQSPARLRQHQISGNSPTGKSLMLQQHLLLSRGVGGGGMARSPTAAKGGEHGFLTLPLTLGSADSLDSRLVVDRSRDDVDASFKSPTGEGPVQGLYNGFAGSLARTAQAANQQHFHHPQSGSISNQSYGGAPSGGMNQAAPGGTGVRKRERRR